MNEDQKDPIDISDKDTDASQPPTQSLSAGDRLAVSSPPSKAKIYKIAVIAIIVLLIAVAGAWWYMDKKDDAAKDAAQQAAPPKVKVGFMMAQSGGAASMGLGAIKGVELAKKQLDASNIDIVKVDSQCNAKGAEAAVKTLIAEKVVAIIGEGCSSASVAALPFANEAKIPMISPSASSPKLSIANDYFFRTVPSDNFQGKYLAEYAYKKGLRRIAQFNTLEPAGASFAEIFGKRFEELGGKITTTATAESHIIDLSSQAKKLAADKPESITIFANTVTSAVALIVLLNQNGYQGGYLGSDALYDKTVITQTGASSDERLTVSSFTLGTKAFKQAMSDGYKSDELAYAAPQAYDALHAIQLAVKTGADTGEKVKAALAATDFVGVSGYRIKFDTFGEISDDVKYSLLEVHDGAFREIEQ